MPPPWEACMRPATLAPAAPVRLSGPERRAAPRFAPAPNASGRLSIAVGGVVRPVPTRDISARGIDLEMPQPFESGTRVGGVRAPAAEDGGPLPGDGGAALWSGARGRHRPRRRVRGL